MLNATESNATEIKTLGTETNNSGVFLTHCLNILLKYIIIVMLNVRTRLFLPTPYIGKRLQIHRHPLQRESIRHRLTSGLFLLLLNINFISYASSNEEITPAKQKTQEHAGDVVSVLGKVLKRSENESKKYLKNIKPGDPIYSGDVINTSSNGGVKILLKDRTILDLGPSALFHVREFLLKRSGDRDVELQLSYGALRTAVVKKVNSKSKFRIRTPSATMGVRGTITYSEVVASPGANNDFEKVSEGTSKNVPIATTFLITQGQAEVTSHHGNLRSPVILNPGDQMVSATVKGMPQFTMEKLNAERFSLKQQKVEGLSKSSDTTFIFATNFDRAQQQRQMNESKSENRMVSSSTLPDQSRPGSSTTSTSSATTGSGSNPGSSIPLSPGFAGGGGILEDISASIVAVAPAPPQVTVTNADIPGVPSATQILNQQSSSAGATPGKNATLNVRVRWSK